MEASSSAASKSSCTTRSKPSLHRRSRARGAVLVAVAALASSRMAFARMESGLSHSTVLVVDLHVAERRLDTRDCKHAQCKTVLSTETSANNYVSAQEVGGLPLTPSPLPPITLRPNPTPKASVDVAAAQPRRRAMRLPHFRPQGERPSSRISAPKAREDIATELSLDSLLVVVMRA